MSPVTEADRAAEDIILAALATRLPRVPVVAEESASRGETPPVDRDFVLVDPLDGTREFIAGRSEYTVNIALVCGGVPVAGAVAAPDLGQVWWGAGDRAWKSDFDADAGIPPSGAEPICCRVAPARVVAVASHNHLDDATRAFLADLTLAESRSIGSSLKFLLLAQGEADVYPRFGPTMEWDTAAGHAVLLAAGGSVTTPDGAPFLYRKPGFRNGPFVARGLAG